MSRKLRFAVGVGVILVAIAYFAFAGYQEGKAYYSTINELNAMGDKAKGRRIRVAGVVEPGSITRTGKDVAFTLRQDAANTLPVYYSGNEPVPDTFKGGAEAVVEGQRRPDGTFAADHIQAKCASKYEAKYGADAQHPQGIPMTGAAADSSGAGGY